MHKSHYILRAVMVTCGAAVARVQWQERVEHKRRKYLAQLLFGTTADWVTANLQLLVGGPRMFDGQVQ